MLTSLKTFLFANSHIIDNFNRKVFHVKDEQVWGNGITLSNASGWKKSFSSILINQNINGNGGNTTHNKRYKLRWELKEG